jgi:hypothetical protein
MTITIIDDDKKAQYGIPRGVQKRLTRLEERRRIAEAREIAAENRARELEAQLGNGAKQTEQLGKE